MWTKTVSINYKIRDTLVCWRYYQNISCKVIFKNEAHDQSVRL